MWIDTGTTVLCKETFRENLKGVSLGGVWEVNRRLHGRGRWPSFTFHVFDPGRVREATSLPDSKLMISRARAKGSVTFTAGFGNFFFGDSMHRRVLKRDLCRQSKRRGTHPILVFAFPGKQAQVEARGIGIVP